METCKACFLSRLNPPRGEPSFGPQEGRRAVVGADVDCFDECSGSGAIGISFRSANTEFRLNNVTFAQDGSGRLWAAIPMAGIENGPERYRSHPLLHAIVPGHHFYDSAVNQLFTGPLPVR
jgi:hypothetical protein